MADEKSSVLEETVPGERAGERIIRIVKKYVGCSLSKRKDELGKLVARGVDNPNVVVGITTNCGTSALGIMAAAGVKHDLLSKKYESGAAIMWLRQIGQDLGALNRFKSDGPMPPPGSLLRYNTAGCNDDHVEWLMSSIDEKGYADHAGGGRGGNAITFEHGMVLKSLGRPLVEWWDPEKLGIDVVFIQQQEQPEKSVAETGEQASENLSDQILVANQEMVKPSDEQVDNKQISEINRNVFRYVLIFISQLFQTLLAFLSRKK